MSGRDVFRLSALAGLGLVVAGIAGVIGGRILMAAAPEDLLGRIAMVGVSFLLIAGLVGWVVWRIMSRRIDWSRIQTEQTLWESGPLGRAWLKVRKRLLDRWPRA